MFENTFKNVDDILHKDAGCSSELDYVEQSSWVLFLKYLEDLEKSRALAKELAGEKYKPLIADKFRWTTWACPKTKEGKIDFNKALSGDDLRDFVNGELFPYLAKFKVAATGSDTLEYKIGEIYGEIKNKIQSGYSLRDILDTVDALRFGSQT
jgi:type I restriction enzyme M protein